MIYLSNLRKVADLYPKIDGLTCVVSQNLDAQYEEDAIIVRYQTHDGFVVSTARLSYQDISGILLNPESQTSVELFERATVNITEHTRLLLDAGIIERFER